jgi:hypothetical protein
MVKKHCLISAPLGFEGHVTEVDRRDRGCTLGQALGCTR